jgi:hypothetical protein
VNIFTRLGLWWDDRAIKKSEFNRWADGLVQELEVIRAEKQIPPQIVKDMAILKQQMDRMELYVGLKREPQATHVQGAPKIS